MSQRKLSYIRPEHNEIRIILLNLAFGAKRIASAPAAVSEGNIQGLREPLGRLLLTLYLL